MKIKNFNDLVANVQAMPKKSSIAVVVSHDLHTLESIVHATKDNMIDPILIGDQAETESVLKSLSQNPRDYTIIQESDTQSCIRRGLLMVHEGKADVIMKGKLETGPIMKGILNKENGLGKGRIISLMGFYETEKYHKLFSVSDMGINTYPDLNGKKDILINAVETLNSLGIVKPKVAVLSAVEKTNPKMPDTVDGAALKEMNEQGAITNCIVEGPISFDLATSKEAAKIKGYISPVAGDADLLLVPDIVSGNILVKCLTGIAGAKTAGLVVGAKVPIVLTSRSAEASDKYYSIALAAYVGQNRF